MAIVCLEEAGYKRADVDTETGGAPCLTYWPYCVNGGT